MSANAARIDAGCTAPASSAAVGCDPTYPSGRDAGAKAGVMPSEQLLTEMGKFNEELVKAGVMLAGEGLHSSSKGARVKFSGSHEIALQPFKSTSKLPASAARMAGQGGADGI